MVSKMRISLVLALLLSVLPILSAYAGGWAVITLDELPSGVVAGEPLTIGFTVLQHGRTPMGGLYPTVTANLFKDDEFVVKATSDGTPGHYTATLTFPKEGDWQWSIQAFTMDQAMPVLHVQAAGTTPPPTSAPLPASTKLLINIGMGALALGALGAFISFRRRSRLATGVTAVCLLLGMILLIVGGITVSSAEAQAKSSGGVADTSSVAQIDLGRKLFIAKGCITCHVNSRAASSNDYWTMEIGAPNLSNFSASPEVLRLRLKDPTVVKSDSQMPNLGLSEPEIEALIAFINSK
jgi:hypothetical protein